MIQSLKGYLLIQDINKIIDLNNKKIIEKMISNGAIVYIVGGAIRDYYLNYSINDLDLEVYNISFDQLKELFKEEKTYINETFKTIKLNNIEIALPRFETKVGLNYTDYQLTFNNIEPKQAIMRRDFTINSLMYNLNENKLYDFCNGVNDLDNNLLKAVNYDKFKEDSIRALRLLKYQSKLNLEIDDRTFKSASEISSDLWKQPEMMVASLFKNIINNKYFKIELLFDVLNDFFEVERLKNNISTSKHHPEKSLYNHIVGTIKCLFLLEIDNKNDFEILFWTLFFHDYGKLDVNHTHNLVSIEYFNKYKDYVVTKRKHQDMIKKLIEDHMCIREYAQNNDEIKMKHLKNKYRNQFHLLTIVGMCDYGGRVLDFNEEKLKERMQEYHEVVIKKYEVL
ncbi:tRNA nucleotidyltransferase (CCA-adding enzyme) [Bacilli bacterium PM5-9]|nr:tRNA nucleotidyltransferase (CCA-adding enzyme) [Bacilli bacterium PM5-9]